LTDGARRPVWVSPLLASHVGQGRAGSAGARHERTEGMGSMHTVLRDAVLQELARVDQVTEENDARSLLPLARTEIHRLADGWRLLLTMHQPDEDGRCAVCRGRFRHRRWPCRVWLTAHQHLISESVPHRRRRRHVRNPFADLLRRRSATTANTKASTTTSGPQTDEAQTTAGWENPVPRRPRASRGQRAPLPVAGGNALT
jgi:hypothetical protein